MDEKISFTVQTAKKTQSPSSIVQNDKTKIILQGYNNKDGIGDFEHLIDFFQISESNFPESAQANLIQGVAFVDSAKLNLAKSILPKSLSERTYIWDRTTPIDKVKAKAASLIIVTGWNSSDKNEDVVLNSSDVLSKAGVLLTPDVFMNISMPLKNIDGGLVNFLPQDCLKYSILEYNAKPELYTKDNVYVHEVPMGFSDEHQQVGIKFNQEISDLRKKSENSKMNMLLSLKNQGLLKALLGVKEIPDFDEERDLIVPPARLVAEKRATHYLQNVPFAMGYLQDVNDTNLFVKTVASHYTDPEFDKKPQLDVMVSKNFIDSLIKETDISTIAAIKKLLAGTKYKSLVILDNDGKVLISFPKDVDPTKTNTLRLIKFNGIDNTDKVTLSSISEAMSGSGDNSFSAVASADVFPYLGMPYWKSGLVALLKRMSIKLDAPELIKFMDLNYQITMAKKLKDEKDNNKDFTDLYNAFIDFASKNYEKIKKQWVILSSVLANNHDVKHYFREIRANDELNQLLMFAGKKENQVDPDVVKTNIKQFESLVVGMFIRGIPFNYEIIKQLNEKIKDILFNACCIHSSEIVGRRVQCQQHLDLLLYVGIMKKDKILCHSAISAGAQLILDPHILNILNEDGANSLHTLDLKNTTDKTIFDMLLHKFPNQTMQALKMENVDKNLPLQATRTDLSKLKLDSDKRAEIVSYLAESGLSLYKLGNDEKLPIPSSAMLINCSSLKETEALKSIISIFQLVSPRDYMKVDGRDIVALKEPAIKQMVSDLTHLKEMQKNIRYK